MTLSLALANAVTGLRAATVQTELASNNISNALTPGYARRDVILSPSAPGGQGAGVKVEGIARAAAFERLAATVGQPGEPRALATLADGFDAALAAAADTPESAPLLAAAVSSASGYVGAVTRAAAEAMAMRTEADSSISRQVSQINDTLNRIEKLNEDIKARVVTGEDASTLQDERDRLIDAISGMVPIKTVQREFGTVALFAKNGAQLLDGSAFELGFTPTALVTPDMTIGNGALSGITLNGFPLRIGEGGGRGLLDGGSLAAAFELRDVEIPARTATLDGLAADMIARTQGLAADPTLAPGDAGLFTDGGAAFVPANIVGLSLRLSVNPAVDPDQGGAAFRLRDGIAAAAAGDPGESALLRGLQDAMRELRNPPAGSGLVGFRGAAGFAAEFSSSVLTAAAGAETEAAFRRGRTDEIADAEKMRTGVDTDQELARLLVIEQVFAANARVVRAVDEMLEQLTRL